MGLSADVDVEFDFDGALRLARRLWALAEYLQALQSNRADSAEVALRRWTGPRATAFSGRHADEQQSFGHVVAGLQSEAMAWAAAWQQAMTQQNWVLYARAERANKADRSNLEKVWGGLVGHDDLPPLPEQVMVPKSPSFSPTATFYAGGGRQ